MSGPSARPEVCVGAVALDADRILLIQRGRGAGQGLWSVPGGRVEHGETLAEAVVREFAEETGLECVCGSLVGWVERIGGGYHYVILDFFVEVLDPTATPVAGDDAADVAWVSLDDLGAWKVVPGLVEFLHDHGVVPDLFA